VNRAFSGRVLVEIDRVSQERRGSIVLAAIVRNRPPRHQDLSSISTLWSPLTASMLEGVGVQGAHVGDVADVTFEEGDPARGLIVSSAMTPPGAAAEQGLEQHQVGRIECSTTCAENTSSDASGRPRTKARASPSTASGGRAVSAIA
jgi:hypothetical protein